MGGSRGGIAPVGSCSRREPLKIKDYLASFRHFPAARLVAGTGARSGFVSAFWGCDVVPLEVLRAALRTTARDARGGFVFAACVENLGVRERPKTLRDCTIIASGGFVFAISTGEGAAFEVLRKALRATARRCLQWLCFCDFARVASIPKRPRRPRTAPQPDASTFGLLVGAVREPPATMLANGKIVAGASSLRVVRERPLRGQAAARRPPAPRSARGLELTSLHGRFLG